ncbi:uncharacterized protein BKA78DRAFT_350646 [Phyllosticta capitalensis]|uniref:uncharacterized protein n=1 Tax=Phyllosticta capitalensis TaxID=121624 RepID=UPI00312F7493
MAEYPAQALERLKAIGIDNLLSDSILRSQPPDPHYPNRKARLGDRATPALPIEEYEPKLINNLDDRNSSTQGPNKYIREVIAADIGQIIQRRNEAVFAERKRKAEEDGVPLLSSKERQKRRPGKLERALTRMQLGGTADSPLSVQPKKGDEHHEQDAMSSKMDVDTA